MTNPSQPGNHYVHASMKRLYANQMEQDGTLNPRAMGHQLAAEYSKFRICGIDDHRIAVMGAIALIDAQKEAAQQREEDLQ